MFNKLKRIRSNIRSSKKVGYETKNERKKVLNECNFFYLLYVAMAHPRNGDLAFKHRDYIKNVHSLVCVAGLTTEIVRSAIAYLIALISMNENGHLQSFTRTFCPRRLAYAYLTRTFPAYAHPAERYQLPP